MVMAMIMTVIMRVAVTMVMIVRMSMIVGMGVAVMVMVTAGTNLFFARTGADFLAQLAFGFCAKALHVMVVAFLGKTHFRLEAEHLFPVLAHLAVHQVSAPLQNFLHAVGHGVDHLRDGRSGSRLSGILYPDDWRRPHPLFHRSVCTRTPVKRKYGKYDHTLVAKLGRMFEAGSDQRER